MNPHNRFPSIYSWGQTIQPFKVAVNLQVFQHLGWNLLYLLFTSSTLFTTIGLVFLKCFDSTLFEIKQTGVSSFCKSTRKQTLHWKVPLGVSKMMLTILFINLKIYLRCSNSLVASEQGRIKQANKTVNLTKGFTFAPIYTWQNELRKNSNKGQS